MDHPAVHIFVQVTIFTLVFSISVSHSRDDLLSLWRHPALLVRALLAVIVLVPVTVALLLLAFDLPPGVATGLALLAAAAGAPLTSKRAGSAGGDRAGAPSLQFTLALLSVAVTPLTLMAFNAVFKLGTGRVTPLEVAGQVAKVQFLPLLLGLALQQFVPAFAKRIRKPVAVLANVLFVLLVLVALVPGVKILLGVGGRPILAIVAMVVVSMAIGHLLGGPRRDHRSALAIACIARNIGLALFIASLADAHEGAVPTLLAYVIIGSLLAIPYSILMKKRIGREPAAPDEERS